MVYVMWQIRPKNEVMDVSSIYAGAPTWFSIKFHHGRKFTTLPDMKYAGGEVCYVDYVDIDEFSVHELDVIMLDLGYPNPRMIELTDESPVIYHHFRIPNENDDQGAEVEAEVHVESPLRIMNHVNDEPVGEYMPLILFGSRSYASLPEYKRGKVWDSKRGEGSCNKRLNLEDIDDLKEKENTDKSVKEVQEAATVVEGCYKPFTSNIANVEDEMIGSDEDYDKDEGDDEDRKQYKNEDQVDDIIDEENNIQDVNVDMTDFYLNVESDVEGARINDFHGHEPKIWK
ncbi:unnamed protein product [Lactuca saligna]|uniref:PB1-like domain-containing protein n=1 Tax=Lactuca saligna TaxID=75948 RepID=A0AA35YSW9_LACSI|nr:unnamed protein product [Lactuca saligna]